MASSIVPFPRRNSNDNSTDPNPPQPGLRSFIVYNELPEGCELVEVLRNTAPPHVRKGDFVLADTADTDPAEGDLFVIQWNDGGREVVELVLQGGHYGQRGQTTPYEWGYRWHVKIYSPAISAATGQIAPDFPVYWMDGPYNVEHIKEKLVGRVIGFYEPDFRAQLRRVA